MKKKLWPILDVLFIAIGLFISVEFYFSLRLSEIRTMQMSRTLPLLLLSTLLGLHFSGIYKSILRFASVDTFIQAIIATLVGTGATYIISLLISLFSRSSEDALGYRLILLPRPVYFIQWVITLALISGSRFFIRYKTAGVGKHSGKEQKKILVIGAGYAGATVIRDIQNGRYGNSVAIAVLDDDKSKRNASISRVPVVGGTKEVAWAVEQYKIDEIIIAIATPKGDIKDLLNECISTNCHVLLYSGAREGSEAREVNIADLLGRAETHLDMGEVQAYFAGKSVLITGGGGSIGSELCRQILSFTPAKLVLYDISENYMYDLLFELKEKYGELVSNTVVLEVGSVRDEESLCRVMEKYKPDIVIHAAAHKHVPLMENSPEQAILNNVFGTYKTAKSAVECGVKRFVLISTDKAVNPTNVMGASKRLAEIVINSIPHTPQKIHQPSQSALSNTDNIEDNWTRENSRRDTEDRRGTEFMAVRFGNVLGSHGSVVPIFERQIKAGGPLTLTSPDIIRYFMTIPEAASLVLQAVSIGRGGELFILDMGEPVRIKDLAEKMISLYGKGNEKIEYVGLRPGEKMYEELLLDKENDRATERERIYITDQEKMEWSEVEQWMTELEACLEMHGDVKKVIRQILPSYHEGGRK